MDKAPRGTSRGRRDFWQLHVPLVIVLTLCAAITVIEARRATEGVWRAWFYMFEWPMIGLFAIWIWYRYRHEGTVTRGLADRWRDRVRQYEAEADAAERADVASAADASVAPADPELAAWEDYRAELRRRDAPGQRPPSEPTG